VLLDQKGGFMTAEDAIFLLCEEYGVEPYNTDGKVKINIQYRISFLKKNVPEDKIEKYLKKVLLSVKSEFLKKGALPSLATLDELLRPSASELEGQANKHFDELVSKVDQYKDLVLDNKRSISALDRIGGWKVLCNSQVDQLPFIRERFIKQYVSCNPDNVEYKRYYGIGELDKVIYIGNNNNRHLIEQTKQNVDNFQIDFTGGLLDG
jgi:hypothetical protein